MNKLTFNLLFFLILVPIKIVDIAVTFPMKFQIFLSNPVDSIFYNIDDILQFATIWKMSALPFIILAIIAVFRFKKIWMSWWYSLALIIPIWNLYLLYKLIFTADIDIKDNKKKILKTDTIKQNETKIDTKLIWEYKTKWNIEDILVLIIVISSIIILLLLSVYYLNSSDTSKYLAIIAYFFLYLSIITLFVINKKYI